MLRILISIFFGWGLGANDSANIFGPSVAAGIVKYKKAIILTAVFIVLGGITEGAKCMSTFGSFSSLNSTTATFCVLSAAIVLSIMTYFAMPASASQAIIGAVAGLGFLSGQLDYMKLLKVVVCWIATPLGAIFLCVLFYKFFTYIFSKFLNNIYYRNKFLLYSVLIAGSYGAYSLGANNTANVTGVYVASGMLTAFSASWIGSFAIAFGVLTYSYKVMSTIGNKIIPLDPFSAFIVTLSNASVVHIFTQLSVPVSSSQAIVGAVIGIGIVKGFKAVKKKTIINICISWVLTPFASGILAVLFYMLATKAFV